MAHQKEWMWCALGFEARPGSSQQKQGVCNRRGSSETKNRTFRLSPEVPVVTLPNRGLAGERKAGAPFREETWPPAPAGALAGTYTPVAHSIAGPLAHH